MATVVVSGRVEESVKLRADAVIRSAGSTAAAVISDVWQSIAETGQLPASSAHADEQAEKQATFSSFMEWFDALPHQNEDFAVMSDDDILVSRVDDYE